MTKKLLLQTVLSLLFVSVMTGSVANACQCESTSISVEASPSAVFSLGSGFCGKGDSEALSSVRCGSVNGSLEGVFLAQAQELAGPPSPGAPTQTSSQSPTPGLVQSSPPPANHPAAGIPGYPYLNSRQAAAARGLPTASLSSPGTLTVSTPPTAADLQRSNRQLSAMLRGSLCFSCLVNLRNQLRALNGVVAVDIKLIRPGAISPNAYSREKMASLDVFYQNPRIDANTIARHIRSKDFNMSNVTDRELIPGARQ